MPAVSNKVQGCFLPGGLINLPVGYPQKPEVFQDLCLLTSVMFGYMKLTNTREYHNIKKLCYRRTPLAKKNLAGEVLLSLIENLCSECDIAMKGPLDMSHVLPIIVNKLNIQIHVIISMDGKTPGLLSYPAGHDLTKPRLYLLQYSKNHVVFIDSLKTFFERQGKLICFGCLKFFSTLWRNRGLPQIHRCFKKMTCFLCNGFLATEKTINVENEIAFFCDSEIKSAQIQPFNCTKCNLLFQSSVCFENHKKKCDSNRGGWYCSECNIFQKCENNSEEEIRLSHVCGTLRKKCNFCYQLKEKEHICKIKPTEIHHIWPNLAFVNMTFQFVGTGNCENCYQIRQQYAVANHLTLPELFKSEIFSELICDKHKNVTESAKPNVICLFSEEKRHFFTEFLFCDDNLSYSNPPTERIDAPYSVHSKPMTTQPCKVKKMSQKVSQLFEKTLNDNCNLANKTAMSQFLLFICSDKFSNYTFIMSGQSLVIIYFIEFIAAAAFISLDSIQNSIINIQDSKLSTLNKLSVYSNELFKICLFLSYSLKHVISF